MFVYNQTLCPSESITALGSVEKRRDIRESLVLK